jgi:hypothetical protein
MASTKVLTMYQESHFLLHPFHHFFLSLPPPNPGTASTGIIFPFTYMCTQYLHHIHRPRALFYLLPPPTGTNPPRQNLFCPPVLWFCKRKKWHLCLFKIATQGVFLWHIHVYMYYNPNWFMSSIFLFSTIVCFLWWFQQA